MDWRLINSTWLPDEWEGGGSSKSFVRGLLPRVAKAAKLLQLNIGWMEDMGEFVSAADAAFNALPRAERTAEVRSAHALITRGMWGEINREKIRRLLLMADSKGEFDSLCYYWQAYKIKHYTTGLNPYEKRHPNWLFLNNRWFFVRCILHYKERARDLK